MDVPFDGIITILVLMIGIFTVFQYIDSDIRRIAITRLTIPREILLSLVISLLVIIVSIYYAQKYPNVEVYVWGLMFSVLIGVVIITSLRAQYKYGWRDVIIKSLKDEIVKEFHKKNGLLNLNDLESLVEIGKQSAPGANREVVIVSLRDIVTEICLDDKYRGDSLEFLIEGLIQMLIAKPVIEDMQNFKISVEILTVVLSSNRPNSNYVLIDQQHAVRALSTLSQTFISEIDLSVGANYILLDYEEALSFAVSRYPQILADVTQALLDVGIVAIEHKHYLLGVATLERLLTIVETHEFLGKAQATLLGLMAHFWCAGKSGREFVHARIPRVRTCIKGTLPSAIKDAKLQLQMTMRFDTADKLASMAEDLQPKRRPRKKK